MNNYEFANSFGFREYNFTNTYHVDLSHGTKYNYVNYLKKGSAEIIGEDFKITLNEGDLVFVPRGLKYHSNWWGDPCVIYNSYAFTNHPNTIMNIYTAQKIIPNSTLLNLMEKLPTDNNINCQSVGNFFLFLDELFKTLTTTENYHKQHILEKALNTIRLNPSMSIPEVAKACGISTSALYLLFSKHLESTPSKYKLSAKLDQAYHYLITTDMSVEDISDLCDFSSSSYFRKNFYKKYNKTPREARKSAIR